MKNNILVWLVLAFGIGAALIGLSKVQDLRKGAFSSQGKVFFTPNDINVKAGEEFVIALSMDSKDQKVSGFRFIVKYPTDLLEYVGSNYNLEYPLRFQGDSANKLTGEIDVVALGSGLAAESLPNGTWVLDTLKFKALKSGTTKFGVTSMDISRYDSANADNNLQINNETVNLVIAEADLPTVSGSISVDNKNVNGDYKVHYYWDLGSKRLSAANFSLSINYTGYPQNLWKNFGSQAGFSEFKVVEVSPGVKNIILADVRPYASLKTGKIELLSFEVPGITSLGGLPHYLLEILPGYQLVAGSETGQTVSLQMINNSWLIDSLAVPPTPTLVPTNSPVPTATNTPVPTATNTPAPTATNTPVPTATNTPAPTATNTPVPTATNTPAPTATNTPVPTATNTPVPTATNTPAPTATLTPTMTPTATPTPVPMCLVCGNGLLSKSLGNAHLVSSVNSTPYCDNSIDLLDFEVWRYEYLDANLGSSVVTRNDWRSDFSCSSTVGLEDFEIWRTNYFRFLGLEI